jgi:NADPH:quinone reductase-like Zn-dependent oxidoreductase
MHAMIIRRYGGAEVFEPGQVPTPQPGAGQVLIRVLGSSVNPVDTAIRAGMLKTFVRLDLPAVLGVDVAGEVVALGPGATRFAIGDRVFAFSGLTRGGGYGEYAVLPESYLGRVPDALSWAEAGTVPGVGATAYEAFTGHAPVRPGMRVFINGGAGGVGTYAAQIAKAMGAEVTATSSGAKADVVRGLGADHVIDYTTTDPYTARDEYDVVLNAVRDAPLADLKLMLEPGGTLVTITGNPPQAVLAKLNNPFSNRRTVVMFVSTSGEILDGLAELIAAGKVKPVVEHTYTWDQLAAAHQRVETGRVLGKVAVVPNLSDGEETMGRKADE